MISELLGLGSGIASAVGGLWQQGQENARRRAIRRYLEQNMGEFQEPNYQFNPNDYKDVLEPMQQENQNALNKVQAIRSLQGGGRSGITAELMARQANRGAQNIGGAMAQMARSGEQDAYNRALQKYQMDMQRKQLIAENM
jgi:hypothetical protein